MYCERCSRLVYKEKCPGCGRRDLRMPREDDLCFLTEPEALWVQALEDLLRDNGVEFLTRNVQESYLMARTGAPRRVRFFVRCRDYRRARELNEAFFNSPFEFEME